LIYFAKKRTGKQTNGGENITPPTCISNGDRSGINIAMTHAYKSTLQDNS